MVYPFPQDREAVRAALLQLDLPNLVDRGEQESEKLKRITIRRVRKCLEGGCVLQSYRIITSP